ncbi:MAG: hemerythrin protein [Proteobacteria bacterium]|nr:hemerythrin protein [Pseudomonadota bacterium]
MNLLETAPSLDEPLEMLEACHDRIEAQLKTLERLLQHLPEHGADLQARQAAQAILRYFDSAGPHHHEDEEDNLFPMLIARSGEDPAVCALVRDLLADHVLMAEALAEVRRQLLLIAEAKSAALEENAVRLLASRYRRHIARENAELLPLSQRLLTPLDMRSLSQAMTARRTINR